ncbi:hypothetical protein Tco_1436417 [Tanacetum coccineum]
MWNNLLDPLNPETADPDTIDKYYESVNLENEVACLTLSKLAKQELFETVKAFHACKQEEGQSISSYILKMKSYLDTLERVTPRQGRNTRRNFMDIITT